MVFLLSRLLKRKKIGEKTQNLSTSLFDEAASAISARDYARALELYRQAITIDSQHAEAHYKHGNALKELGRLPEAILSYDRAVSLKPDYAHAHCNRGVAQQALGMTSEALSSYDLAIAHDPSDAVSHFNRALLLQSCSRWSEAIESYNRAICVNPAFADAQYNRAVALLNCGDFEHGWRCYEWRWKIAGRLGLGEARKFTAPLWLGEESICGKRILLHAEGGLGDTLQFCRYARMVAERGATVYLEVPASLVRLLANLDGVAGVVAQGDALPPIDFHCPMLSLPLAFNTTLECVPAAPKYLRTDAVLVSKWLQQLKNDSRPRVGLVWSGNSAHTSDQRRSIRLADWVVRLPRGFQYFRLQRDVRADDLATLDSHPEILSPEKDFSDFVSIAALCECMDIVITVDTSLAHLSAALGRRTWIMLPDGADWRWLHDREDSPWYPSAKLYRQQGAGDWEKVFERIADDLRQEFRVN